MASPNLLFFKKCMLCCLLIFFFTKFTNAQISSDTTTVWEIGTKDGNVYRGKIMSKNAKLIFLKTESLGTLALKRKEIVRRKVFKKSQMIDGEIVYENQLANRYMLASSGMFQARGEGYYENKYVFVNHLNLGITDGFSLGLGTIPTFIFGGSGTPVWIIPKFKIRTKNKNLHLSFGTAWGKLLFDDYYSDYNYFIPYTMGTYGNENISISVGAAYGYWEDEWMNYPAFTFSGSVRVGSRSYLFLENFFINAFTKNTANNYNDDFPKMLNVIGMRQSWRKITLDYGIFIPSRIEDDNNEDMFVALPYLAIIVPFGSKK